LEGDDPAEGPPHKPERCPRCEGDTWRIYGDFIECANEKCNHHLNVRITGDFG